MVMRNMRIETEGLSPSSGDVVGSLCGGCSGSSTGDRVRLIGEYGYDTEYDQRQEPSKTLVSRSDANTRTENV